MSEPRRSYRTKDVQSEPVKREDVPVTKDNAKATDKKYEGGDSPYRNISGLFRSKSGKADTVRVTDEIFERIQSIKVGDVIGVSLGKNDRLNLWFIVNEEKEDE